jgi:hypothetical protein
VENFKAKSAWQTTGVDRETVSDGRLVLARRKAEWQ